MFKKTAYIDKKNYSKYFVKFKRVVCIDNMHVYYYFEHELRKGKSILCSCKINCVGCCLQQTVLENLFNVCILESLKEPFALTIGSLLL